MPTLPLPSRLVGPPGACHTMPLRPGEGSPLKTLNWLLPPVLALPQRLSKAATSRGSKQANSDRWTDGQAGGPTEPQPRLSKCAMPEPPPQALGVAGTSLHISSKADVCTGWLCRVRAPHLELPVWEPQHGNR